jgi:hypothetical protein
VKRAAATLAASFLGVACLTSAASPTFEFRGDKALIAVARDGSRIRIGTVSFAARVDGMPAGFSVRIDPQVMQDHFLSMREFKCLPAAPEVTCFVPYPHPQPGTVSAGQYTWLEHSLLFFHKQPADFGARLWNGIIFKFTLTPTGLVGKPQAVDLNRIGVPPDGADEPPYGPMDRDDYPPGARWVTELRIE